MALPDMGDYNEACSKRTVESRLHCITDNRSVVEDIIYSIETRQYVAQLYDTYRTIGLLVNRWLVGTQC